MNVGSQGYHVAPAIGGVFGYVRHMGRAIYGIEEAMHLDIAAVVCRHLNSTTYDSDHREMVEGDL